MKTGSQEIGQTRVERKCKWKPKAGKFNIHRHYSSPTICKTSKKLEFHKLSFQKMFRWECNLNISKKDICGVNSGNLFLHLHWFEIGAWIRVSIHLPGPWGEILTRPLTGTIKDSQLHWFLTKYKIKNIKKSTKSKKEKSLLTSLVTEPDEECTIKAEPLKYSWQQQQKTNNDFYK